MFGDTKRRCSSLQIKFKSNVEVVLKQTDLIIHPNITVFNHFTTNQMKTSNINDSFLLFFKDPALSNIKKSHVRNCFVGKNQTVTEKSVVNVWFSFLLI